MEPLFAGNVVQLTIFVGICVGYISTYVLRVANKVAILLMPYTAGLYLPTALCALTLVSLPWSFRRR